MLFQERLRIERLKLACATDHEQEDDVLRPGREVWLSGRKWRAGVSRRHGLSTDRPLIQEQAGQSDAAQADFLEEPAAVPPNRSSFIGCVSEHK